MPKVQRRWNVQPHDALTPVGARMLTVVGYISMPLTRLPRRMTLVRLRDGGLVVYSAIALQEAAMAEIERFGRPAFLVVPSDKHRMDARIWKDRYPRMQVVAPAGSGNRVSDVVAVDDTSPDFGDPDVRFVVVPGTGDAEGALVVKDGAGTSLVVNDIIGNIRNARGFGRWFLGWMGFAGEAPRIPGIVKRLLIKDRAALREQLLLWAKDPTIERIVVSHGDIIEDHPRDTLMKLAESLG